MRVIRVVALVVLAACPPGPITDLSETDTDADTDSDADADADADADTDTDTDSDADTDPPVEALMITELVSIVGSSSDAGLIEVTNVGNVSVDLGDYWIGRWGSGGGTAEDGLRGVTQLSGTLAPDASHELLIRSAAANAVYSEVYGLTADQTVTEAVGVDTGPPVSQLWHFGTTSIGLFEGEPDGDEPLIPGNLVDLYGVPGTHSSAQWGFQEGYACRETSADPSASFLVAQWQSHEQLWDSSSTAWADAKKLMQANTTPGAHQCAAPAR